jgi:hypothetical protein
MVIQHDMQADTNGKKADHQLNKFAQGAYALIKDLVVPIAAVALGGYFTWSQFQISNARQDADAADKAIETREQVLTDYSKTIAGLMTKSKETNNEEYISNFNKQSIARGQTFIALRRLNLSGEKRKDDANKLKGLLIRYLYELHVIDNYEFDEQGRKVLNAADINLEGADIDNVVLKDAWLPGIDLTGAWLRYSNFTNADLPGATLRNTNLTGANLTGADLTGADIRFAKLINANLTHAVLKGACYVEGTEAQHFPPGFKPEAHNMVAISKDQSDPNQPDAFKPCPEVSIP